MPEQTRKQILEDQLFLNGAKGNPDIQETYGILAEICEIDRLEMVAEQEAAEKARADLLAQAGEQDQT